ncbi:MAG TPA: UbiA-like polyprenyltransferase [Thermoanaerobaculia bacterium]|nr:UbiA-like polyprenyltransferase [Thermoanaerobaculia bacterium]
MSRLAEYAELVKLPHTLFALPFALAGALLGAGGLPPLAVAGWVVVAMVGARTAGMAFNRLADRRFDAANPRTADRALPAGRVRPAEAWALVAGGVGLFLLACWALNGWTLALAPLALALVLGYSLTKRFTHGSHLVLGAALALAPFGGWLASRGTPAGFPWPLSLAVLAWVAGFDTLYACLDVDFDRRAGLYSLPARFGPAGALALARWFHALAFAGFVATGWWADLGWPWWLGLSGAGVALVAQHALVKPGDLSRMQLAFFTLNAGVSTVLLLATWASLTPWGR